MPDDGKDMESFNPQGEMGGMKRTKKKLLDEANEEACLQDTVENGYSIDIQKLFDDKIKAKNK